MRKSKRVCGGCTACCKALPVFKIDKPRGKWCKYCTIGEGCNIYPTRPKDCKSFKCQWLKGYGSDDLRPDISKVVIDLLRVPRLGKVAFIWEVVEGALEKKAAQETTKLCMSNGIPVCHKFLSGKDTVFIPREMEVSEKTIHQLIEEGARVFIVDTLP